MLSYTPYSQPYLYTHPVLVLYLSVLVETFRDRPIEFRPILKTFLF